MHPVTRYGARPPPESFARFLVAEQQKAHKAVSGGAGAVSSSSITSSSSSSNSNTGAGGVYMRIDAADSRVDGAARRLAVALRTALAMRQRVTALALQLHQSAVDRHM